MGALRPRRRPSSPGLPPLPPLLLLPALLGVVLLVLVVPAQGQLFSSLASNDILRPLRLVRDWLLTTTGDWTGDR